MKTNPWFSFDNSQAKRQRRCVAVKKFPLAFKSHVANPKVQIGDELTVEACSVTSPPRAHFDLPGPH